MNIYNWLLIIIGAAIVIDGIGSALIASNYHSVWFDGERYARALAGVAIIVLAVLMR
jgi:hypothetical protein